jgi:hypothetical protein
MGEILVHFPRIVAWYKMDNNYDEYVREETEITAMGIITEILISWLDTWEQFLSV